MAARAFRFRQADVSRAVKGALAAGLTVGRVEVGQDGRIIIVPGAEAAEPATDFDRWKANRNARSA